MDAPRITLVFQLGTRLREIERLAIRETLLLVGFDKVAAAKSLGISRSALYAKMNRLGIPLDCAEIAEEEPTDRLDRGSAPDPARGQVPSTPMLKRSTGPGAEPLVGPVKARSDSHPLDGGPPA